MIVPLLGLLPTASPAAAEPSAEDKALAAELFERARALMGAKSYADACRAFAESQRLDPGGGTLLNLAVCHERLGRVATAWTEYRDALAVAKRDGRDDRIALAGKQIAALQPRLSRLTVVVPPNHRVEGLVVERDAQPLAPSAWGITVPIDPGTHIVSAQAPQYRTWRQTLVVADYGDQQTVTVPLLAFDPTAPKPGEEPTPEREEPTSASVTIAYVTGGITLAAATVGTVLGVNAMLKWSTVEDNCPQPDHCNEVGAEVSRDAGLAADGSTVSFVVAGVGAASTIVLLAFRPFDDNPDEGAADEGLAWSIGPTIGPGGGGALVVGTF